MGEVFAEGDEAGEGGNGCTQTADVDTGEHVLPLIGKAGEHNGCRNIADDLTGTNGGKQCVCLQQLLQELTEATAAEAGDQLAGLTFVLTGTLPDMSRDEASALIKAAGGKVTGVRNTGEWYGDRKRRIDLSNRLPK